MQKKYYDGAQVCKILGECIEDHKTYLRVLNAFANEPSADVVEVVRCKDCRKWCICHHSDDYYCADGERREDE